MLKDITIGQYYPAQSRIHSLDPRTKLSGTMLFLISLFINRSLVGYLYATIVLIGIIHISKVPFSYMVRGLKSIIVIVSLSLILTMFYTKSGTLLVKFWIIEITTGGIELALYLGIRIVLLIIGSTIMTLTTTPKALTDGLEKGLGFLKVIHFPVDIMAMMMSIALRFIPILTEEMDKIMKAQMARGVDFEAGGLIKKVKSMVPLLVPLIISAFRRAADLAQAMDARCYNGGAYRTKMKPLKYQKEDQIAYVALWGYVLGMIVLRILFGRLGWNI